MTQQTPDKYRVFGNPVEHSRSPEIHHIFADKSQQNINYQKQLVDLDGFSKAVADFIHQNGKGANVTVPFKEQALALADELTERALLAGAVNTLTFKEGKIFGDNTDGEGLVQDLMSNQVTLKHSRILLLGAGGAVRGVLLPLLAQNPNLIVIANRTISKADKICQHFADNRLSTSSYQDLAKQNFDIIINATSASLSGDSPPIPASIISQDVVCYDMVYGKTCDTPFLHCGLQQNGAVKSYRWLRNVGWTSSGLAFLYGAAWSLKFQPVIDKLRASL